jgi:hypothetical protein
MSRLGLRAVGLTVVGCRMGLVVGNESGCVEIKIGMFVAGIREERCEG